jgi:hypothetical protein
VTSRLGTGKPLTFFYSVPPFGPMEGQKWFAQISNQWEIQKNRFALISVGKIQFLPPCIWNLPFMSYRRWTDTLVSIYIVSSYLPPHIHVFWGGIQERTVGLRFLGIILRVLRLEVSTLVLCLSTRCSSWTDLSFLHWLIVLYGFLNHKGSMIIC